MRQTGAKKGVWVATKKVVVVVVVVVLMVVLVVSPNFIAHCVKLNATPVSSRVACTCPPCDMFVQNSRDKSTETKQRMPIKILFLRLHSSIPMDDYHFANGHSFFLTAGNIVDVDVHVHLTDPVSNGGEKK